MALGRYRVGWCWRFADSGTRAAVPARGSPPAAKTEERSASVRMDCLALVAGEPVAYVVCLL